MALVHLGSAALTVGKPVQHHTGEISRNRTSIRYYQSLLGRDRYWVLTHPDEVSDAMRALELGNWSIKEHTSRRASTAHIRRQVSEFVEQGNPNPLVIVDYLDLIDPTDRKMEGRFALTAVSRELREIAAEFECAVWSASQVSRGVWGSSNIRMQDVAEAIGKVEAADVVVTLNQTSEEKGVGRMRWYVDKARERVLTEPEVHTIVNTEHQSFKDALD